MSSTNHTANYNLPQFVGTDKPTWLGDVNSAMFAIDAQMKTNADNITTAGGQVSELGTTVSGLSTSVENLNTSVGTLENDVNTVSGSVSTLDTKLTALINKFNLNDSDDLEITLPSGLTVVLNNVRLVQNSDGSLFKFYGLLRLQRSSSSNVVINLSAVAGLANTYGLATGLYLNNAPTTAYLVNGGGQQVRSTADGSNVTTLIGANFAVGTDGQIYIFATTSPSITVYGNTLTQFFYWASLYFNDNFGDVE